MKKATKITSALLMIGLLCTCFISCDKQDTTIGDSKPTDKNQEVTQTEYQTVQTEQETAHTEHEGSGKCSVCGIDYYEVMANYVKKNGVFEQKAYRISRELDGAIYEIAWFESDGIRFSMNRGDSRYSTSLSLSKSGVKYGEYDWHCFYIGPNGVGTGTVNGMWKPDTVSPGSLIYLEKLTTSLDEEITEKAIRKANSDARTIINEVIIPFLEECGNNLSPSDFGFVRFED